MGGTSMYLVILFCLQFIKCTPPPAGHITSTSLLCTQNDHGGKPSLGEWRAEDTLFALRQVWASPSLLVNCIVFSLSVAAINYCGVTVTKMASAGARSITEPLRTISIWCFFLLPIVEHCHRERFNVIQFLGFMFLIAGNLIYNQIVTLPFSKKVNELDIENDNPKIGQNYETIASELSKTEKI